MPDTAPAPGTGIGSLDVCVRRVHASASQEDAACSSAASC